MARSWILVASQVAVEDSVSQGEFQAKVMRSLLHLSGTSLFAISHS